MTQPLILHLVVNRGVFTIYSDKKHELNDVCRRLNTTLFDRVSFWVGQNCGRKIRYWVRSVFSWTVRTL